MRNTKNVILFSTMLACAVGAGAAEKALDFWDEEIRSIATAPAGQHVDWKLDTLRSPAYFYNRPPAAFQLDHTDKKMGDLSLVYLPGQVEPAGKAKTGKKTSSSPIEKVGFLANLWGGKWSLTDAMALKFHLKTTGSNNPDLWQVVLVDEPGKTARATLEGTDTKAAWREMKLPLKSFKADEGFDWTAVRLCEFEAQFSEDSEVRFDGVRFEDEATYLGVTDKPVSQRMAEAEANLGFRVNHAIRLGAKGGHSKVVQAFNRMFLNEDLENANALLVEDIKQSAEIEDTWSLLTTPLYCRFYYMFSNRAGKFPGRMKPEVEKMLLEILWERTKVKNDIHWARKSTWWLDGSENHDLNARACNLVTSRIFMNEPEYKERIYPDYGFGGAYHYGPSGYLGEGVDPASRHGGGRANLKDGKEYKAADHYQAWLAYLKEYFRERARRGFFLENWSAGYTKHTYNMMDLAHQCGGDDELKDVIGDFLTLYWADWAQKQISGVLGGTKTRHHYTVGGYGSDAGLVQSHLGGGAGDGGVWTYWNLYTDFRLPKVVWQMALDRQGMGSFAYLSRGIGEEENVWPRPLGTERTMCIDTESRFLKYTYATPDYTLGTQMDHPAAVHCHLSKTGRWHGMTTAQSPAARVVPVRLLHKASKKDLPYDMEGMFRTVQHENALIVQQFRTWLSVSPDWFPGEGQGRGGDSRHDQDIGVYVGKDWDRKIEQDGWIFLEKGNAYVAIRVVLWDEEAEKQRKDQSAMKDQYGFNNANAVHTVKLLDKAYAWSEDGTIIQLKDRYSPVIVQAGRRAEHPTLEGFIADVLDNRIALYPMVVPGCHTLTYTPCGPNAPLMEFNDSSSEIPLIGGKSINYSHPKTFDSPYLQSDYKSGIVHIKYGNEKLMLDFNQYSKE